MTQAEDVVDPSHDKVQVAVALVTLSGAVETAANPQAERLLLEYMELLVADARPRQASVASLRVIQ